MSSIQAFPFNVTTSRDSYTFYYRELANLLSLSEILAEGEFEPPTGHRVNAQESSHTLFYRIEAVIVSKEGHASYPLSLLMANTQWNNSNGGFPIEIEAWYIPALHYSLDSSIITSSEKLLQLLRKINESIMSLE